MKNKTEILTEVTQAGIIPVIKIEKLDYAIPLANALQKGNIHTIEITVRNNIAFDAIKTIHQAYPNMFVGAGTILSVEMVKNAVLSGASYIVTPGFNPEVVKYCITHEIPVIPGCVTPTEIDMAHSLGLKTVKFFPAEKNGGLETITLISGPYSDMNFIPTGGINFNNLASYLKNDKIVACGGSFMAPSATIQNQDWETITRNCQKAVTLSLGFELAHVGINHSDEQPAYSNATKLNSLLNLGVKDGNSSLFCGTAVEFMKTNYYGEKGHIGFYTNSVPRALTWFKKHNIDVREESIRYDSNNKMVSFYLKDEINGFAIHVVRR